METLIPIAVAVGFPIMWMCVSLSVSHIGGWARLAKRFPVFDDEPGETYYMRSGYIGRVNYRSCLILRVCKNGLRLSVQFLFRIGHPPLFIPWDQFHNVSEKRVFFFRFLDAYVGTPVVAHVLLPTWLCDHLPVETNPVND